MRDRELRTRFSMQALSLAGSFGNVLGVLRLAPADYVPELTAPEGPSTGGGIQAMQHLRLVPSREGFSTLVFGNVNQKEGRAELRTYEHIDAIHRQRFKRPVELDRKQYADLVQKAQAFLDLVKLQTALVGVPADLGRPSRPPPEPSKPAPVLLVGFLFGMLVVLAGVAAWIFLFRRR